MSKAPAAQLSLRQQRFVAALVADPHANAANAARLAGYSRRHSADAGCRLMQNALVRAEVDRARTEIAERGNFGADVAMRRLDAAAAFARETKNATALARVIELQLRLFGLLVDRAQLQVEYLDLGGVIHEARKRTQIPYTEYQEVPINPFE